MNFKSLNNLSADVLKNIDLIPKDIDLIVGIPRSGMLVANYLALLLNKPCTDIEGLFEDRVYKPGNTKNTSNYIKKISDCKKILIIDDSVASGRAMAEVKERVSKLSLDASVLFAAIYVFSDNKEIVDIYFEIVEPPRVFEWNLFSHSAIMPYTCFDIDGVLCVDPTDEQNDDGRRYIDFILSAKPKIIPSEKIGYIVTSRLNKYRSYTEEWLRINNIEYGELIMLDSTAEERREKGLHASFKANIYKRINSMLFIESEEDQALEINRITGKPVYCVSTAQFYTESKMHKKKRLIKESISRKLSNYRLLYSIASKAYHFLKYK